MLIPGFDVNGRSRKNCSITLKRTGNGTKAVLLLSNSEVLINRHGFSELLWAGSLKIEPLGFEEVVFTG